MRVAILDVDVYEERLAEGSFAVATLVRDIAAQIDYRYDEVFLWGLFYHYNISNLRGFGVLGLKVPTT